MMKKTFLKSVTVLTASFVLLLADSCSVGLGAAVDTDAPTIEISYPPKNAVIRESFIASGLCDDDIGLDYIEVTVTNTETRQVYGPYEATLSEEEDSWSIELNQRTEGEFDAYNSYMQWEFPDGYYIISAIAYDKSGRESQETALPVSIDNTAPVLLVSKPLAVGTENASTYGRNLNIIGDISEAHETTKLTLNYREFNEGSNSFVDSDVRTLEITGFGTMSSDNPLTIAKFDESTTESASSILTNNYKTIYGQEVDVSRSNQKNYYCGFLLEDNARVYKNPGDSGVEPGNQTTQYYILSDLYNEALFSDSAYSLNARNLMLLLNGQSSYTSAQISSIVDILKETGNSASSTDLESDKSSKFAIDPKNNPIWSITNFNFHDGIFDDYDLGAAIPLVLKVGGDGIEIDKSSLSVELYHLGYADTPGEITAETPHLTLISPGEYTEGLLKERVNQADSALVFTPTDIGIKINHFYEFVITGNDLSGNAIESEDGLRFGFKRKSTYTDPRFIFTSDSESFEENAFYSGARVNNSGITIKGSIVTGHKDIEIEEPGKISISGISITDISDSASAVVASASDDSAEVKYRYEITSLVKTYDGDDSNGKSYNFTAKIYPKDNTSILAPLNKSAYKYKVGFIAEDSLHAKNDVNEFEFKVDNKEPEVPADDIVITPLVNQNGTNYVNGIVIVSGSISDVGSGFNNLKWKIDNGAETLVSGAGSTWSFSLDTTQYPDNTSPYLNLIVTDNVGNQSTTPYQLHINQATDKPVITFTNNKDATGKDVIFTNNNKVLVGSVTDDDGLASVTAALGGNPVNAGAVTAGSTSHGLKITLPETEGEYQISVTATDSPTRHLNSSEAPAAKNQTSLVTVMVDNGAPDLTITSSTNSTAATYYQNAQTVTGTIKDGSGVVTLTRVIKKIENDIETAVGEPVIITAGNGTAEEIRSQIIAGTAAWTDNTISITQSGTYKIIYTAKDKYAAQYEGHATTKEIIYSIDKELPEIRAVNLDGNAITGWLSKNFGSFTVETADGLIGSGVVTVAYTTTDPATADPANPDSTPVWVNMSGSGNNWESFIAFEASSTTKHLWFQATDKAGNKSTIEHIQLQMDVNPPTLTASGISGNKYVNQQSPVTFTVNFYDGNGESGIPALAQNPLKIKIGDTELLPQAFTVSPAATENYYDVSIAGASLADGALTITGRDIATNETEKVLCTIIVDTAEPQINNLTLTMSNTTADTKTVYKKAASETLARDTWYINRGNTKTATLTITGTATDNFLFDKINLLIAGAGLTSSITRSSTSASEWTEFSGISLQSAQTSSDVTLTAFDKAGNYNDECFDIIYDETKPTRVGNIKNGTGNYSDKRYGRLTAIDFTATYKEEDSGLKELRYYLYDADKTTSYIAELGDDLTQEQVTTGLTTLKNSLKTGIDTQPASFWSASGKFTIAEENTGSAINATASISGFKQTRGSKTNYLLLRPVDNCGNLGNVEVLSINVDQTAPTVVSNSAEKLTNGTTPIYLNGAVYDNDSGLKALRVYVNGTLAIDGKYNNKTANANKPNWFTVVKKDKDGNTTTNDNNAVEVSFSNQYGTLTYIGYTDDSQSEKSPFSKYAKYATWTLTLTPNAGSWFTSLPANTEHHVVAIAAEDWADEWKNYSGTGNVPPNPAKVALLKKDVKPPKVESISPANGAVINGTNTITGTTSDEGSVPAEVSLYYALSTEAGAAPDGIGGYTRLKTITTEEEPSSPDSLTDYGKNISDLYNYSFTQNFFAEQFISPTAVDPVKYVWILVRVKDAAGNESAMNPVKYKIDRNKDRPTISFTDISLAGVTSDNPAIIRSASTSNHEVSVNIGISDDDGAVTSAQYRKITLPATDPDAEPVIGSWNNITLSGGSGGFNLSTEGLQTIEFKVVDSKGTEFTSRGEITTSEGVETRDWKRIYITDSTGTATSLSSLPVILDTYEPDVTLTHIGTTPAADFNQKLGGNTSSILLKFTATDNGSGIDDNEVKASVTLGGSPVTGSPTVEKLGTGLYAVTIPCNSGSGSVTVTLSAKDKAGFEGSFEKQFEQDNQAAGITVNTPDSTREWSGTPAATGSITEGVRLYYAVSPISASPKNYTSETPFSYTKKNSEDTGVTESVALSDSEALAELCSYTAYNEANTEVNSFTIDLNLNSWLTAMGITTDEDLNAATDPFDDIVKLYLHLKAEDSVGNESEKVHEIWVDPQGDRPKVYFTYPDRENPTLGGAINIVGSVEGKSSSYTVNMQILDNEDNVLNSYDITPEGTVWRKKINESGDLDPTVEGQTRTIKIRLTAEDAEGRTSSVKTKIINIDNDKPVINQNVQLVKWNDGFNAANGLALKADGSAQLETDGSVKFANGAVKARRAYSEGMSIAGKWYVVGSVTDYSGISEVRTGGASGTLLSETLSSNEAIIVPYNVANGVDVTTNYVFSFPVGSSENDAVGTSQVTVYAKDNGTGEKAKAVTEELSLNYDNKKPVVIDLQNGLKVMNNNGYYTFGSEAYEETIGGANQSGVERIAFYFTRSLNGQNTALNTLIRLGRTGNQMPVSDFTESEGLLWQSVAVSSVSETVITVGSLPVYVHKGGLVKVNETIYKITNITGSQVTLSGAPGSASEAFFTFAGVIDSDEDIPADAAKITDDYGYGLPVSNHDIDGDLIPESCLKSGAKWTWEASINSKNMSDGPVVLNYVVFDKAGNYYAHSTEGIVQNNSPRLAGAYIGTDENGNNAVDDSEFVSYHQLYAGGYNGVKKITELTLPTEASVAAPASAIKIKRKTVIKPEIVGGNGRLGYTYTVSKRNAAGTAWEDKYFDTGNIPEEIGTGTGDSDDLVTLASEGIVLTVDNILRNGIRDGNYQKFAFTIWDSTQGLTYGQDTQSAVLNVIMDVALNDTTPATNKIIPFYWKDADNNSLKDNSKDKGHIELSKDLPETITVKTPKVSGAFKLEGIAQDNSLLKNLYVKIKGTEYLLASYADGVWTTNNGTGWSAEIKQATYAELRAAGYITATPAGKRDRDNVPYASQDYGHIVHWTMNIDTEAMGITPEEGIEISVSALDKGTPYTETGAVNRDDGGALIYTSKAFANNGDGDLPEQTGGDDGEHDYTCRYTIDVVPYITTIKTKLSENSKKADSTEFDRTALGHYPVAVGETIRMSGFNLANGTVKFTSSDGNPAEVAYNANGFVLPSNAKSGKVSIVVAEVESYNNRNNNNSQGSYGAAMPNAADYGDKKKTYNIFTNFYNRSPNTANNYILTDDVEFDVWMFNSRAAKTYAAGVVSDPIMKVNPNNGVIGFAYQSGERRFSMAKGNDNSYQGYIGDYDNQSATGFAYDSAGNTYGVSLGGDINGANSVAKFTFMSSLWGSSGMGDSANKEGGSHHRFEQIGQIGTKADRTPAGGATTDSPGQYIDKSRALSPSIAVSGSGTNATVYLAYYDNFNQEIRFRWASRPNNGSKGFNGVDGATDNRGKYIDDNYGSKNLGSNGTKQAGNGKWWSIDRYNTINFQIIAEEKSYTYPEVVSGQNDAYMSAAGTEKTSTALGISGPYVDIAVLPANSAGNSNNYDVVVLVWYDSKNNKLKYTYNTVDLASVSRADFEGSAHTQEHWHSATTIFSHAGYYCNIEVDGNGGVHIAAYDNDAGDIYYAKLPSFGAAYNANTMSCVVDSNGMVGSNLTLDVAYDKAAADGGKAIPYISYYGSIGPKLAYLTSEGASQTNVPAGALKDKFTGFWEITEIPTTSNAPKDRVNVAVWKDGNGIIKDSTSTKTALVPAGTNTTAENAVTIGNGTTNPVIGYEIRPTSSEGYMETAQKK